MTQTNSSCHLCGQTLPDEVRYDIRPAKSDGKIWVMARLGTYVGVAWADKDDAADLLAARNKALTRALFERSNAEYADHVRKQLEHEL